LLCVDEARGDGGVVLGVRVHVGKEFAVVLLALDAGGEADVGGEGGDRTSREKPLMPTRTTSTPPMIVTAWKSAPSAKATYGVVRATLTVGAPDGEESALLLLTRPLPPPPPGGGAL
jgi:hypothetical protein